ncbi:hypothetical protein ASPZODRAFT_61048 [Penicilliopsis zonata CBS 506.65]|uniref:Zn(2)-C6 fungal-type domain-containing protein n=1 Tax=Penicilliopsis zonata CBS 506.65 TaxID=1073090 RepID=A0A1L9SPG3_9EURO|nr:hypothetical protein ASPZODRAFT_61048 [Penicilliopsis zonata CBS 506.65]OJJ48991.1 hypothetical protein ASPZODRAFT_61048 [Penicilliopsis zonata CBS 506.65]
MTSPYQPSMSFSPSTASTDLAATANNARTVSDLPQSEVDAIIRTKRKAREPKACYPCHARKVKCDRNLPCDGCVKRDHADLCSYERPSKKRVASSALLDSPLGALGMDRTAAAAAAVHDDTLINVKMEMPPSRPSLLGGLGAGLGGGGGGGGGPGRVSIPREDWENVCNRLKDMEKTISSLRVGLEKVEEGQASGLDTGSVQSGDASSRSKGASPEREGIHAANTLGEGTVHLGSRSVLAYILNNKSGSDQLQALLEGGILPKLGLDNESATYPFVDLWSSDMSPFDVSAVCGALPSDQQCKEFFFYYRDIAGAIYPVLEDVNQFGATLEVLLQNRASTGGVYRADQNHGQRPFGVSLSYLGLLFAVLASGCQSSDLPSKERELTSQVYVCCSYQCLRMTNFLSQPTIDAIQTLLVIGNVLSYNMNPGISYVLLGMTLRMGLALGLHVESSRFSEAERYRRRHVWWSMAWQDSHFSLSYDRPSTTAVSQPDIAYKPGSKPGELSYFETLCRIISLALEVVRSRMLSPHSRLNVKSIQAYNDKIQQIMIEAKPHLRDRKYCLTSTDHLERVVLKLHSSYFSSELCRPSLKPTVDIHDPATAQMRSDCVTNLIITVEAYIEMHTISSHASRSWIALQRAISSAFLLAVIEECKSDPHVWSLLRQLEAIITERATSEREYATTTTTAAAAAATTTTTTTDVGGTIPGNGTFNTIPGITNTTAPGDFNPANVTMTSSVPASVAADTQTQWAKPLTKTLHALQKLNAAFGNSSSRMSGSGTSSGSPAYLTHTGPGVGATNTTHTTTAPGISNLMPPVSAGMASTTNMGSLPPPTPESSSSSEWTMPTLLDRAAEYIHPPLWG